MLCQGATIAMVGLAGGLAHIPLVALILNNISVAGIFVGNIEQTKELVTLYGTAKVILERPLSIFLILT